MFIPLIYALICFRIERIDDLGFMEKNNNEMDTQFIIVVKNLFLIAILSPAISDEIYEQITDSSSMCVNRRMFLVFILLKLVLIN